MSRQNFGIIESINYGCAITKGLNKLKMGELIRCQATSSTGSIAKILPRLGVILLLQIITGLFLSSFYVPHPSGELLIGYAMSSILTHFIVGAFYK